MVWGSRGLGIFNKGSIRATALGGRGVKGLRALIVWVFLVCCQIFGLKTSYTFLFKEQPSGCTWCTIGFLPCS